MSYRRYKVVAKTKYHRDDFRIVLCVYQLHREATGDGMTRWSCLAVSRTKRGGGETRRRMIEITRVGEERVP